MSFYDPEGNKYAAWEMQTVNCYFEGSVSEFLAKVSANFRGASKKVKFLNAHKLREKDPEGLQEVIEILQQFNAKHPESISLSGL